MRQLWHLLLAHKVSALSSCCAVRSQCSLRRLLLLFRSVRGVVTYAYVQAHSMPVVWLQRHAPRHACMAREMVSAHASCLLCWCAHLAPPQLDIYMST
jgi:hypothetical protein